jgi:4a-hydroxytetrahydrobiopterin dehydratase
VEIGAVAQARDHHPDVALGWGKVKLSWSTHDAGGISARDRELAEESDRRYRT